MTEYLAAGGGTAACEMAGQGPLTVVAHGPGGSRAANGAVVPRLAVPRRLAFARPGAAGA